MPPRAAIGYSLLPMLHVLRAAGVADFDDREYHEALQAARERCEGYGPGARNNAAAAMASELHGKTGFVYAAPALLEGVARRWPARSTRMQRRWRVPRSSDSTQRDRGMGGRAPDEARRDHFARGPRGSPDHAPHGSQSSLRPVRRPRGAAGSASRRLARMLALMLLGDFTSVYLAYLNDVDPTPVKKIDALKAELAGR
jgi:glucose/mannose-6-phosphate isomerase